MNVTELFSTYRGSLDWLQQGLLYLTKHGSHAYGTNRPDSDLDIKGVAIPPVEYFFGWLEHFEQADSGFDSDVQIYDIRKFFNLAADCNPNIIEVLWTDPNDWIEYNRFGIELHELRGQFISKKARHTFAGYAHAQLKRIMTHQRWLRKPPSHKPTREEYDLPPLKKAADKEQIMAAEFLNEQYGYGPGTNFQDLIEREKKYRNALKDWDSYERWKRERNPARHELEAKFGYDTKHAMHLVRLLRMCGEILETGKVIVKRPDAKELLEIRNGSWPFEKLIEWAGTEDARMEKLYEASSLPHAPDRKKLDQICVQLVEDFHYAHNAGTCERWS
jgi:predicted nucleotidyltransferase